MATPVNDLLLAVRRSLTELSPASFSDDELIDHMNRGARDLWKRIADLYKHHFVTRDRTHVFAQASSDELAGVPDDCYRIVTLEPRVVGQNNVCPGLIFKPRPFTHPDFVNARARGPIEPTNAVVYFDIMNAGAPVDAPTIVIAPTLTRDVDLLCAYVHTLQRFDEDDNNPIPGESDAALIAWTIAWAKSKERDDRAPDPEWLAMYGTEKQNTVVSLATRQEQESDVVQGMFEDGESEA